VPDFESGAAPGELPKPVREGLPQGYRMRADTHYVEQLTGESGPMPLRLVPLSAIDEPEWVEPSDLAPLIVSIRALGILHPLLVRAENGRYQIIAGRKRFYAAQAIGLSAVPCFVHHVEPEEAEALAHADNLQCVVSVPVIEASPSANRSADLFKQLSEHLAGIASARELLLEGKSIGQRAALDLIHVHTTRGQWLIRATDLVAAPKRKSEHRQTLGALIDGLAIQFAPESRLSGVVLRTRIDDRAYSQRLDTHPFSTGLMGAIIAFLPFVDVENHGALMMTAARQSESLTIEIGQTPTLMDSELARSFFDPAWTTRPGGWPALLGILALKKAVESYGGSVVCEADSSHARIRITLSEKR
jgi:hypothetical protein